MHERQPGRHVMQISFVDLRCFFTEQACFNLHACRTQVRKTFSGNLWIEIFDWRDDALDAGGDQRVRARRRASMMRVRLKRNESGATACSIACKIERNRLGVFDVFEDVKALANNLTRSPN